MRVLLRIFIVLLVLSLFHQSAYATVQVDFTVDDMIRWSHFAVEGIVDTAVCSDTACTYTIRVLNVLSGFTGRRFEVSVPTTVQGEPYLQLNATYYLFINLDNRIEPIIGLARGVVQEVDGRMLDLNGRLVVLHENRLRSLSDPDLAGGEPLLTPSSYADHIKSRAKALRESQPIDR